MKLIFFPVSFREINNATLDYLFIASGARAKLIRMRKLRFFSKGKSTFNNVYGNFYFTTNL